MHESEKIARGIIKRAEFIEKQKNGKALTEDESKTLATAEFLRKVAPYLSIEGYESCKRCGGTIAPPDIWSCICGTCMHFRRAL
jgi:hypothetical protein